MRCTICENPALITIYRGEQIIKSMEVKNPTLKSKSLAYHLTGFKAGHEVLTEEEYDYLLLKEAIFKYTRLKFRRKLNKDYESPCSNGHRNMISVLISSGHVILEPKDGEILGGRDTTFLYKV